jgi:hypothetical protein
MDIRNYFGLEPPSDQTVIQLQPLPRPIAEQTATTWDNSVPYMSTALITQPGTLAEDIRMELLTSAVLDANRQAALMKAGFIGTESSVYDPE